jgi:hypothetical protein
LRRSAGASRALRDGTGRPQAARAQVWVSHRFRVGNPDNYTLPVALADLSAVLSALEMAPALFVGTSYGRRQLHKMH